MLASMSARMAGGEEWAGYHAKNLADTEWQHDRIRCGMGVVPNKNERRSGMTCVVTVETRLSYVIEEQPHGRAARWFARRPPWRAWQRGGVLVLLCFRRCEPLQSDLVPGRIVCRERTTTTKCMTQRRAREEHPGAARRGCAASEEQHAHTSPRVLPVSNPGHDVRLHVGDDVAPPLAGRGELLLSHLLLLAALALARVQGRAAAAAAASASASAAEAAAVAAAEGARNDEKEERGRTGKERAQLREDRSRMRTVSLALVGHSRGQRCPLHVRHRECRGLDLLAPRAVRMVSTRQLPGWFSGACCAGCAHNVWGWGAARNCVLCTRSPRSPDHIKAPWALRLIKWRLRSLACSLPVSSFHLLLRLDASCRMVELKRRRRHYSGPLLSHSLALGG